MFQTAHTSLQVTGMIAEATESADVTPPAYSLIDVLTM
jgi:hypothetical protein